MFVENLSLLDSIYFTLIIVATVWYGDIHARSTVEKNLSLMLIVSRVGTFLSIVTCITGKFLKRCEKSFRRQKLNMVADLFFSELWTELLNKYTRLDP